MFRNLSEIYPLSFTYRKYFVNIVKLSGYISQGRSPGTYLEGATSCNLPVGRFTAFKPSYQGHQFGRTNFKLEFESRVENGF